MRKLGSATTNGDSASVQVGKPVKTQYVLVWFTALPYAPGDQYSGSGYKQAVTDVEFKG
jgi:hypothetical protein